MESYSITVVKTFCKKNRQLLNSLAVIAKLVKSFLQVSALGSK